jgi:hypothetical protein
MTKKLNENNVVNELHGESAFFRRQNYEETAGNQQVQPEIETTPISPKTELANQLTDQSPAESTTMKFDASPVLSRPKAFYITEKQVEDLDILVKKLTKKLKEKGELKIDRSVVVRLILEITRLTDETTVDKLASHMTDRLVSQLTGRQA